MAESTNNAMQEQVKAFMHAMNQEVPLGPTIPTLKIQKLRVELIDEELTELVDAVTVLHDVQDSEILTKVADTLADLLYVVHGAAIAYGINITPIFNVVHAANMTKTTGPVSDSGKKLKPFGWVGPEAAIRSHIIQQIDNAALKLVKEGIDYES